MWTTEELEEMRRADAEIEAQIVAERRAAREAKRNKKCRPQRGKTVRSSAWQYRREKAIWLRRKKLMP